jgi:hydrogenase maturation protease
MSYTATDTLIIGYGNPLRSDDAVGLHIVRGLAAAGYRVIETFQLAPELAEDIAAVRRVIFVDCQVGLAPGEIAVSSVSRNRHPDTHLQTPEDLLRLASDVYSVEPEAFLVGIGPEFMDMGETLSPAVSASIPRAIRKVKSLLCSDQDAERTSTR